MQKKLIACAISTMVFLTAEAFAAPAFPTNVVPVVSVAPIISAPEPCVTSGMGQWASTQTQTQTLCVGHPIEEPDGNGTGGTQTSDTEVAHTSLDDYLETIGIQTTRFPDGHLEASGSSGLLSYSPRALTGLSTLATNALNCSMNGICVNSVEGLADSLSVGYSVLGQAEILDPASHDLGELTIHANQQGFTLAKGQDGTLTAKAIGQENTTIKLRLAAALTRKKGDSKPGIRIEGGRIIEQYADGLEQELVPVPVPVPVATPAAVQPSPVVN